MKLSDAFLFPGTKICQMLGLDPQADAGLIRWMFNTIFYLVIGMGVVVWAVV